jgi:hypothetical protein
MIYLVKKEGRVIPFYSEADMKKAGFSKADKTVSDDDFAANGCYARLIDGKIVIGKTDSEKQVEQNAERIGALKRQLADTDYIAVKIAEGAASASQYADRLAERQAWRAEIRQLESA